MIEVRAVDRKAYARFSLGVLVVLVAMSVWVAAGYGFPGGSLLRRATGHEGPTGGMTTAMRAMLRGDFRGGYARHRAAPLMFAYLVAQLAWRAIVVGRRPDPVALWIVDLVASLTLFAIVIYVPWLTR